MGKKKKTQKKTLAFIFSGPGMIWFEHLKCIRDSCGSAQGSLGPHLGPALKQCCQGGMFNKRGSLHGGGWVPENRRGEWMTVWMFLTRCLSVPCPPVGSPLGPGLRGLRDLASLLVSLSWCPTSDLSRASVIRALPTELPNGLCIFCEETITNVAPVTKQ